MSLIQQLKNSNRESAFNSRMHYLNSIGRDTSIIQDGIKKISENLLKGAKSLVVYGEPQSGKTEFMIALVCRLLDEGQKTIFVIMNDNTELEVQNFERFKEAIQINPSPMTAEQFIELPDSDKSTEQPKIIFCRKNASILRKLIIETRFLKNRLIIDDEADFASPDGKVNKNSEPSTINALVKELGQLSNEGQGRYIGVTATPGRLDLNGTFANNSRDWVFLQSHKAYKGREFFFPISEEQEKKSDYILKLLPDEGDDKKTLQEAALRFLVRAAVVNLDNGKSSSPMGFSMLVHTEGKVTYHEDDQKIIQKIISTLINEKQPKADQYANYMLKVAEKEINKHNLNFTARHAVGFVLENLGKNSTLIINHKKDKNNVKAACEPKDIFTFAFGGNIISRGLTFNRLLSFYFSRNVKHKLQQNTYIQRARMFGNREYSKYFELCVPQTLFENWADCFVEHELSLQSAIAGEYIHIASAKTSPADTASIDKSRTVNYGNEMLLGQVFKMPNGIEKKFAENLIRPAFEFIEELIESKYMPSEAIGSGFLYQIKALCEMANEEPKIVMAAGGGFIHPATTSYFDEKTIIRSRGGLVAQTIKGRQQYFGVPIIMPVKNKYGQMRFYFKTNLGKKVTKFIG